MKVTEVIKIYQDEGEVRLFLVFSGRVQGVGFRWTTQDLAKRVGVTGWVRNMDDGTVQAEMQGTGAAICSVLEGLNKQYEQARASKYAFLSFLNLHFEIDTCERRALHTVEEGETFEVRE